MPKKKQEKKLAKATAAQAIGKAILGLVSEVPTSHEAQSPTPHERAREIQIAGALRAAGVSGALALPPGPFALLTILPDLGAVWKLQAQMVADIAAAYGKTAKLSQEQMLYCLFRHAAAQAFRDVTLRVGERLVFRPATMRVLQKLGERVGVKLTQRVIAKSVAKWLPVVGAVGVGAYAYYDTTQVGATAIELFEQDFEITSAEP